MKVPIQLCICLQRFQMYPDQKGEDDGSGNKVYKNHKLYYHYLGTEQAKDILVVEFPENPDYVM
jgi:Prolyl oligopeptidase, N-terminal beta-propeller domain